MKTPSLDRFSQAIEPTYYPECPSCKKQVRDVGRRLLITSLAGMMFCDDFCLGEWLADNIDRVSYEEEVVGL